MNLSATEGYNNSLYVPYQTGVDSCPGYWLATPSSYSGQLINMLVEHMNPSYACSLNIETFRTGFAFRPVIRLPYSVISE